LNEYKINKKWKTNRYKKKLQQILHKIYLTFLSVHSHDVGWFGQGECGCLLIKFKLARIDILGILTDVIPLPKKQSIHHENIWRKVLWLVHWDDMSPILFMSEQTAIDNGNQLMNLTINKAATCFYKISRVKCSCL